MCCDSKLSSTSINDKASRFVDDDVRLVVLGLMCGADMSSGDESLVLTPREGEEDGELVDDVTS